MDRNGENRGQLTWIIKDDLRFVKDEHPTWSPDSESIVFHSLRRDGGIGIYLVDISSSDVDRMRHAHDSWSYQPDWCHPGPFSVSPVGNRITTWGGVEENRVLPPMNYARGWRREKGLAVRQLPIPPYLSDILCQSNA